MKKPLKSIDLDLHFRILHLLEDNPDISQREIARKLGISLGGVNYCLRSLIDIGHIKIHNFNENPKKIGYLYLLTPKGISEKVKGYSSYFNALPPKRFSPDRMIFLGLDPLKMNCTE